VLAELAERLDPERLVRWPRPDLSRRSGWDTCRAGRGSRCCRGTLAKWTAEQRPRFVPPAGGRACSARAEDARWRVVVNEAVEAET
jgi:hypothetical protein